MATAPCYTPAAHSMLPRRIVALLLVGPALLLSCKRKPAIPPDVIVRVNERMVTVADFKRYLDRNAGTDLAQLTPEVASAMLDQFTEEVILSEYAAAHGVEVPADKIAAAVRNEAGATVIEKRDEMRREKLLASLSGEIPEPSTAEIQTYWDQHQGDFRSGEEVRVRQILVHDEALANTIVKQLRGGAAFEELSSQHSSAPNAKRGGEIGFVSRGELPKMFEDEIFKLKPGQVSDAIQTDSSFHIFRVDDRRAPGTLDAESAAPLIRVRIREDALRERMAQLVARSRQQMQIDVLTRRLPFRYTGTLRKTTDE
ncbi:MAG TPA: peptidyl-prolyl cis-trans isomerase [Thermoanaerobaculia bacterium]|nr:peptidyl-prolyl cis-trans isomerase [Thermoanaerobaculia bacterium]